MIPTKIEVKGKLKAIINKEKMDIKNERELYDFLGLLHILDEYGVKLGTMKITIGDEK